MHTQLGAMATSVTYAVSANRVTDLRDHAYGSGGSMPSKPLCLWCLCRGCFFGGLWW
jgi:hypothetical protein